MNKQNIIIALLLLVIVSYGALQGFNYFQEKSYNDGVNDGVIQVAQTQTQTGNIIFVNNQTLDSVNIKDLCGVEE